MDAALTTKAEGLAREMATSAGTIDDLNARMRAMMKSPSSGCSTPRWTTT